MLREVWLKWPATAHAPAYDSSRRTFAISNNPFDRDLLFGILALQMDFVDRGALLEALHAWMKDKARPLVDILVDRGSLSAQRRQLLAPLVEEHIHQHENDPRQSLASLDSIGSLHDELRNIGDADIERTLAALPRATVDPEATGSVRAEPSGASPRSASPANQAAARRFRIIRPHARGGLGEVFLARDEELGREVALKEILREQSSNAEGRDRFVREAEITGGLEHPGIVPVYGLGHYEDGRPYYAMRFIRGASLKSAIDGFHRQGFKSKRDRDRARRELLGRFIDVCNAIEYAHSRGVLHRDLKPGNIMLGNYGETLVVDWGLAKVVGRSETHQAKGEATLPLNSAGGSSETMPGSAIGTPAFMSPEQASGQLDSLGPTTDIYSLGATLFTLLVGKAPFEGNALSVLDQVKRGLGATPRQVDRRVPKPLSAICAKALALLPENRYASCAALAADVEAWLADERVTAYRESPLAKGGRWFRRHRSLAAAGFALLVTAVVGLLIGNIAVTRQRRLAENARESAERRRLEVEQAMRLVDAGNYIGLVNLADQAIRANDFKEASRLLDAAPAPLRSLEWTMLQNRIQTTLREFNVGGSSRGGVSNSRGESLSGHHSIAFSPSGESLASASGFQNDVILWKAFSGQQAAKLAGSSMPVTCVAMSQDGNWIVAGASNGAVRVWNAASKAPAGEFRDIESSIQCVAISPDSTLVACAGWGKRVSVWNRASGRKLRQFDLPNVLSLAFHPDSDRLAAAGVGEVKLFSVKGGKELLTVVGHSAVAMSHDGKWLAAPSQKNAITVWEIGTGQLVSTYDGHSEPPHTLAFSADDRFVVSAGNDRTVQIWDARLGQVIRRSLGHGVVMAVAVDPRFSRFASLNTGGGVRIEHLPRSDFLGQDSESAGNAIAASDDGRWLAVAGRDHFIRLWSLPDRKEFLALRGHNNTIFDLAFDRTGARLASASQDGHVMLWNVENGERIADIEDAEGGIRSVALDPGCRWVAYARPLGGVRVLSLADMSDSRTLEAHVSPVSALAVDPEGDRLAAGDNEGRVVCWDLRGQGAIWRQEGHKGRIRDLGFSADGTRLASASGDYVRSVNQHDGSLNSTQVGEYAIRVWEANSGQPHCAMTGHTLSINALAWLEGNRRLATASEDGTVRIWDADDGRPILTLREGNRSFRTATASNERRRLFCGDDRNRLIELDGRDHSRLGTTADWIVVTYLANHPLPSLATQALENASFLDTATRRTAIDQIQARGLTDSAAADNAWTQLAHASQSDSVTEAAARTIAAVLGRNPTSLLARRGRILARARQGAFDEAMGAADAETGAPFQLGIRALFELSREETANAAATIQTTRGQLPAADDKGEGDVTLFLNDTAADIARRIASESDALYRAQKFEDAARHATIAIDLGNAPPLAYRVRADSFGAMGDFARAAADGESAIRAGDQGIENAIAVPLMHLGAGDFAAYRDRCRRLLARLEPNPPPWLALRVAWTCALLPDVFEDPAELKRLADRASQGLKENPLAELVDAIVQYRLGEVAQAVPKLNTLAKKFGLGSLLTSGNRNVEVLAHANCLAFLTVAHRQLGEVDESKATERQLQAALARVDVQKGAAPIGGPWFVPFSLKLYGEYLDEVQ